MKDRERIYKLKENMNIGTIKAFMYKIYKKYGIKELTITDEEILKSENYKISSNENQINHSHTLSILKRSDK